MVKSEITQNFLAYLKAIITKQQDDPNSMPWWGWLLLIMPLLYILYYIFFKKADNEMPVELEEAVTRETQSLEEEIPAADDEMLAVDTEQALEAQIKGLELEQSAEDLLSEKGVIESLDVIETDLDGIEGPEIVQVVKKVVAEDEDMKVSKTTETVSSFIDGTAMTGVSETLHADTEDLDVTRITQRVDTEGEGVDLVESADTFVVDGKDMDVVESVETLIDETTESGTLDVTRTIYDEEKGIGTVETAQTTFEEAEEFAAEATDEADNFVERASTLNFKEAAEAAAPDDLTLIEGIGPKFNSILHGAGVYTFADLAALDPEKIKNIITAAGLRLADTSTWPMQARLAAEGKLEELKELQDKLQGGKFA